jgi:hypothetical protein
MIETTYIFLLIGIYLDICSKNYFKKVFPKRRVLPSMRFIGLRVLYSS